MGRAFITVTTSSVFWHGGGFDRIADELNNSSASHTYRFAIGLDGVVQIFRDDKRLAVRTAAGSPDPLARTKAAYIQGGEGAGASEADAVVTSLGYDVTGAYRP
jgi:hypothetical protein